VPVVPLVFKNKMRMIAKIGKLLLTPCLYEGKSIFEFTPICQKSPVFALRVPSIFTTPLDREDAITKMSILFWLGAVLGLGLLDVEWLERN